jgi:hypothetical protein
MGRRRIAIGALALVGGGGLVAGLLAPVTATAAPSPQPRSYTYGNWSTVGSGFNSNQVYTILKDDTGTLYVTGTFTQSGPFTTVNRVAKSTGTSWSDLGTDDSGVDPTVPPTAAGNASPWPPAPSPR